MRKSKIAGEMQHKSSKIENGAQFEKNSKKFFKKSIRVPLKSSAKSEFRRETNREESEKAKIASDTENSKFFFLLFISSPFAFLVIIPQKSYKNHIFAYFCLQGTNKRTAATIAITTKITSPSTAASIVNPLKRTNTISAATAIGKII